MNFEKEQRWKHRMFTHGGVAQLGEHLPCKQGVRSSILLISTTSVPLDPLGFAVGDSENAKW